jgi:hypothetical protein
MTAVIIPFFFTCCAIPLLDTIRKQDAASKAGYEILKSYILYFQTVVKKDR